MEGVYLLQVICDNDFGHVVGRWFGLAVRCKLRAGKQTDLGLIPVLALLSLPKQSAVSV